MIEFGTFITVCVALLTLIIGVGGQAIVTRTSLSNKSEQFKSKLFEQDRKIELLRENTIKEIDKLKLDEATAKIGLTDALAKLNSVLNDLKIQFTEARAISIRQSEVIEELKQELREFKSDIRKDIDALKDIKYGNIPIKYAKTPNKK